MTTTKTAIDSKEAIAKAEAAFERTTAPALKKLRAATDAAWDTYYAETITARAKRKAAVARAEKGRTSTEKEK